LTVNLQGLSLSLVDLNVPTAYRATQTHYPETILPRGRGWCRSLEIQPQLVVLDLDAHLFQV
jgi:hypothetical protein